MHIYLLFLLYSIYCTTHASQIITPVVDNSDITTDAGIIDISTSDIYSIRQIAAYKGKIIIYGSVPVDRLQFVSYSLDNLAVVATASMPGNFIDPYQLTSSTTGLNQVCFDTTNGYVYIPYRHNGSIVIEKRKLDDLTVDSNFGTAGQATITINGLSLDPACIIQGAQYNYVCFKDSHEATYITKFNPTTGEVIATYTNESLTGNFADGIEIGNYLVMRKKSASNYYYSVSLNNNSTFTVNNSVYLSTTSSQAFKYDSKSFMVCMGRSIYKYSLNLQTGMLSLDTSFGSASEQGMFDINILGGLSITLNHIYFLSTQYFFATGYTVNNGSHQTPAIFAIDMTTGLPKIDLGFYSQGYWSYSRTYGGAPVTNNSSSAFTVAVLGTTITDLSIVIGNPNQLVKLVNVSLANSSNPSKGLLSALVQQTKSIKERVNLANSTNIYDSSSNIREMISN